MPPSLENDVFDPGSRRLCPDGACVGVLDDAGRCPVCGRRGEPAPARDLAPSGDASGTAAGLASAPEAPWSDAPAHTEDSETDVARSAPTGGFDSKRRLCPDGTCLGVIEPGGVCNVCGRAAS